MNHNHGLYPRPGRLVDVDGVGMHLYSVGAGTPAVVMEAAIGDFSLTWSLIHDEVGGSAHAVAYDRAGLGWSEVSPKPRTSQVMVDELRQLLTAAGIPGPYVMVGHSFASLLVRLFAYVYPQDIAGIVLLDPAHEDQFLRFPEQVRALFGQVREDQIGLLRQNAETVQLQGPEKVTPLAVAPASFPPEVAAAYQRQSVADPSRIETMIQELENLELSQQQVRDKRSLTLGRIPLTVLSHGRPQVIPGMPDEVNQAYEHAWQEMQIEMAGMSARGRRVVADESGHNIHHEQPGLVIDEILAMVKGYKGNRESGEGV